MRKLTNVKVLNRANGKSCSCRESGDGILIRYLVRTPVTATFKQVLCWAIDVFETDSRGPGSWFCYVSASMTKRTKRREWEVCVHRARDV